MYKYLFITWKLIKFKVEDIKWEELVYKFVTQWNKEGNIFDKNRLLNNLFTITLNLIMTITYIYMVYMCMYFYIACY